MFQLFIAEVVAVSNFFVNITSMRIQLRSRGKKNPLHNGFKFEVIIISSFHYIWKNVELLSVTISSQTNLWLSDLSVTSGLVQLQMESFCTDGMTKQEQYVLILTILYTVAGTNKSLAPGWRDKHSEKLQLQLLERKAT